MPGLRYLSFALAVVAAGCGGPVLAPAPASGQLIAHGGGPGGPGDACFTCHGFQGEGGERIPRLAGLDAGYIAKQLDDYARETRPDSVMTPIARRMRDGDRLAAALYYSSMSSDAPGTPALANAIYHAGDRARGIRRCAACHGVDGRGEGPANPAVAGQPAAYTAEQLQRWKRSVRRNDARDVMGALARRLTDEEIEELALYIEQMREEF